MGAILEEILDQLNADTLSAAILVVCFVIGAWLGSWFPDIDQRIGFLRHRSIVTHGIWMPALLLVGVGVARLDRVDWFIGGFAAGVAVHLAFDLFPDGWRGYALITVPIVGAMSKNVSRAWIALSVFACLSIAVILADGHGSVGLIAYGASLWMLYAYGVVAQKERLAGPLLTLLVLGGAAATLPVAGFAGWI